MPDNYKVPVSVPNIPLTCVQLINELASEIERVSGNLQQTAGHMQTFMGQANGAVQKVTSMSKGHGAQALGTTWHYTRMDGNHAHDGISGVASHLSRIPGQIYEQLKAVQGGIAAVHTVLDQGGSVMVGEASYLEGEISGLTTALNNIGLACEAAATLISSVNDGMPGACATGFMPTMKPPVFPKTAFDPPGLARAVPPGDWQMLPREDDPFDPTLPDTRPTYFENNGFEASLYPDGELGIAWIDRLSQLLSLPSLVNWLGNDVQKITAYASDGFAARYFATDALAQQTMQRLNVLVAKMGFQGVLERSGGRIGIVFTRR